MKVDMNNMVEIYDVITLEDFWGNKKTFKVVPNKCESDKQYIGLKCSQRFTDNWGRKWTVTKIEKNNKYAGLESILPVMSKVPDRPVGHWASGPSIDYLAVRQDVRMNKQECGWCYF